MYTQGNLFYRWSATCIITGALLLGVGYLLRANIEKEAIDGFATTQGFISSFLVATGSPLLLFGLPGYFAVQHLYHTKSGFIASGLSFMGIATFHLGTLALYFVLPVLVNHNEATRALIYSDVPPFPRFAIFWAISLLLQSIGLFWLSVKQWKAASFPRIVPLLLMAGSLLFLIAPAVYFPLIKPANTLVMLGLIISAVYIPQFAEKESLQKAASFI